MNVDVTLDMSGHARPAESVSVDEGGGQKPSPTLQLETALADAGHDVIVGCDEVGRGALAGPAMVGAAAIWSRDVYDLQVPEGVADSKMLTERRREALFEPLQQWCAAWAIGQASNEEIDEWGIGHALGVAALRALREVERTLSVREGMSVGVILDGPHDYITKAVDSFDAPEVVVRPTVITKVKGDRHCASVAAAAVLAKVTRDRLMVDVARGNARFAPYAWEKNKGYGSAAHRAAIAEYGPTALHRLSWHLT